MQAAHKHCKASWTRRTFHHFTHSHLCSRIFSLLLPVTIIFYLNFNYGDFQERGEGESLRTTIHKELCFLELCQFWSQEAALAKKNLINPRLLWHRRKVAFNSSEIFQHLSPSQQETSPTTKNNSLILCCRCQSWLAFQTAFQKLSPKGAILLKYHLGNPLKQIGGWETAVQLQTRSVCDLRDLKRPSAQGN